MNILEDLLGKEGKREEIEDFVHRYEEGPPHEGISDEETQRHHDEVASRLSPDEYREAATDAFARLDPDERRQVGRELRRRAREHGVESDIADDESLRDPGLLGSLAGMLHGKQPGVLGQLLGGAGGGSFGSGAGRGVLGGIAAMAAKRFMKR